MHTFDTLRGGSRVRLAAMRAYRDRWNADDGHKQRGSLLPAGFAGCLQARGHGAGKWSSDNHGLADGIAHARRHRQNFVAAPTELVDGWRDVGHADDVLREYTYPRDRHTGWYADPDGIGLCRGHVWQLPARDGSPQYMAGYVETENLFGRGQENVSGYCVLELDVRGRLATYDTAEDAARAGDALAQSCAETEFEYQERWREAQRHDEAREEARRDLAAAHGRARGIVDAWREQRNAGALVPAVCAILREQFDSARAAMREALETIADETAEIERLGMAGEF